MNIKNKAYEQLGFLLDSGELTVAKDLRVALNHGASRVEGVAMKLNNLAREVRGGYYEVQQALDLVEAQKRGRLLREATVYLYVMDGGGHEAEGDALLLELGGDLCVFAVWSDRVLTVLRDWVVDESIHDIEEIAEAVESVKLWLSHGNVTETVELEDADGQTWCELHKDWAEADGDEADDD